MSFGSETGRSRGGSKSFSTKEKKQKRKKQEFHTHKHSHLQTEEVDLRQVKERTMIALDRLGHQVLSSEPGGYDLKAWTRSLNSLLDDFQEKIGDGPLTEEFRERRRQAELSLVVPSTADEDKEIERLNKESAAARTTIEELEGKATAKMASLRDERDGAEKRLKVEKQKLAVAIEERKSRSMFSRMLNRGTSTKEAEESVAQVEHKLETVQDEIETSRKSRSVAGGRSLGEFESARLEALQKLEDIRKRLDAIRSAEQTHLQLSQEREAATKSISQAISAMNLGGEAPAESE